MAKLVWDQTGERLYETGVKDCVLYPQDNTGAYPTGVAWNGVSAINEKPSGAEPSPVYANDKKYLNLRSVEEYASSIEAYTYPDEFAECDGSAEIATGIMAGQQARKPFGLAYISTIGNDTSFNDHGYKIHIVYGATASPTEIGHTTINDSPEAMTMSWEISTTPVSVTGFKPTACLTIDSTKVSATNMAALKDQLFGRDASDAVGTEGQQGYVAAVEAITPNLPLPDAIVALVGGSGVVAG